MQIFVTGATGFLGRATCTQLLAAGHRVITTGRNRDIGAALAAQGAVFHAIDLANVSAQTLVRVAEGAEVVIHCAANCSPWGSYASHHAANVVATRQVIAASL